MQRIKRALKLIRTRIVSTGEDPQKAIAHLWGQLSSSLTPDDRHYLMMEGLRELVSATLAGDRGGTFHNSIVQAVVTDYSTPPKTIWVTVVYQTATDYKPLMQFTPDDCRFVADKHRLQSQGLLRLAAFMDHLRQTMLSHHVAVAQDLPSSIRNQLAAQWPERPLEESVAS